MSEVHEYLAEAFGQYMKDRGVDIAGLARDCLEQEESYKDAECLFESNLDYHIVEFLDRLGDYIGEDVEMAVNQMYEFDRLLNVEGEE